MAEREPDRELYKHADPLDALNRSMPLDQKLASIHEVLYEQVGSVDRISVAAYDPASDLLKTFLASSPGGNNLVRYEARLAESPSLAEILRAGRPRVVNDLELFRRGRHLHTRVITEDGYRWSYTVPMYLDGSFWGFIFFNSRSAGVLPEPALRTLDVYGHLISAIVTAEMLAVRILAAAVKTAHDMVHFRDPETGGHIDRMARYARLIAQHLAATGAASLDDAAIERIFEFAPLHDIGKLALPDRILLKNGRYTPEEFEIMKTHPTLGRDAIVRAQELSGQRMNFLEVAKEIVYSHHEKWDGSGYPQGLAGEAIPLAARLMAVADVYDALISHRIYKSGMTHARAMQLIADGRGTHFDPDVVDAFVALGPTFEAISVRFADTDLEIWQKAEYLSYIL